MNLKSNRRRRRNRADGFTLLEVMIAMLVAMIGLMGSVAIQQTVLNASRSANDAQIAMRIAQQTLEQLGTRVTIPGPIPLDLLAPIQDGPNWHGFADFAAVTEYVDLNGNAKTLPTPLEIATTFRFQRRVRVTDMGAALPYNITIEVQYALENLNPKLVRLDSERRKSW